MSSWGFGDFGGGMLVEMLELCGFLYLDRSPALWLLKVGDVETQFIPMFRGYVLQACNDH